MAGGISGWWRNRVKNHRQKVMKMFLELSDIKLGRITRKRFRYDDCKVWTMTKIISSVIAVIGLVLITFMNFFLEGHFNWKSILIFDLLWLAIFGVLLFIEAIITEKGSVFNNMGRMGSIIGPLSEWTGLSDSLYVYSFDELFLTCHEVGMFEDIRDWSDEDLGKFMRIVIGCLMIYVNDDGNPDEEVLNKLLKDIHAVQIFDGIKSRVTARRNARLKREEEVKHRLDLERERARKASSASMAEEVKASLVHEEPDSSDPDVVRLNNIAESMRNKTEELRNVAQNKLRGTLE